MFNHVLCLNFNITQLYRWVILNLLAHIFRRKVVDTYQLQNLIELEVNLTYFILEKKLILRNINLYEGARPCSGRTDNMCSKNLFSLMRVLGLEVFLHQAFFFRGEPGDSNLLLNGLAISLEPSHGDILKLRWFKILR